MDPTKIITCTCNDADQDRLHGNKKRVANAYGKPRKGYRCTCCRKEVSEGDTKKKEVKAEVKKSAKK